MKHCLIRGQFQTKQLFIDRCGEFATIQTWIWCEIHMGNVSTQGAVTFAKVEQIFVISIGIYSPDQLSDKQAADLRNKL